MKISSQIRLQTLISLIFTLLISLALYFTVPFWGYKVPALVLLMLIAIFSLFFELIPVIACASTSALIWNFFFIPPTFTFHISDAEDSLMFLMYFIFAFVYAITSSRIKELNKIKNEKSQNEKTIKLYNDFLNSLSHELKTPISTIIGAIDTIKENNIHLGEFQKNILLTEIQLASFRLNKEVENLLNMSRLESAMLSPKKDWHDMNDIIPVVLRKLNALKQNRSISIEMQDDFPLIFTDAMMLSQAVQNIIHNAIIYTPEESTIRINCVIDSDILQIEISDDGPGIAAELQSKIFEKFFRLPGEKTGGTGLGLSIAKNFIEAMGGQLNLSSIIKKGSTFQIILPTETSYMKNINNE